jgi:hypothetical protein
VLVGIADVDSLVPKGSPVDKFADANTTSLYTGIHTFPMLPEELSTDRTSLLADSKDRLAVITEFVVLADGNLDDAQTKIYIARVVNKAKLVYERVGAWLEDHGDPPHGGPDIAAQVKLQDEAAQRLRALRHEHGALDLETIEASPVMQDDHVVSLEVQHKNRARELIEDLMIAANGATARYLEQRGLSSMRRVVAKPKRWDRIVELAGSLGTKLPVEPDAKALSDFLAVRRAADPTKFADLSLSIVKLLGPGQYVLQLDRAESPLSRSDHAAPAQGGRPQPAPAVHRRRIDHDRRSLHRARERRPQGRADDAQGRRRRFPVFSHRRRVRRDRHRCLRQGHVRPPVLAAGRRPHHPRRAGPRRRRQAPREARRHRRREGLHRLRPRLIAAL